MDSGELVLRETVYSGRVTVHRDRVRMPTGLEVVEEVVDDPHGTVVVVAVLDASLVMVEQYRQAVGESLLELPAGTPEAGESLEEAARRELAEETGLVAPSLRRLGGCWALPGLLRSWTEVFRADDLKPGRARPAGDEVIAARLVGLDQIRGLLESGRLKDLNSIAALAMAGLIGPAAFRR